MKKMNKFQEINKYRHRLEQVRRQMEHLQSQVMILPVADEYLGEYMAEYARRVEWLCGFTGSAGTVVILNNINGETDDKAALFVDGRYTVQAAKEVDSELYEIFNISDKTIDEYIAGHIKNDSDEIKAIYNPFLHSYSQIERLNRRLGERLDNICLLLVSAEENNPIDECWKNRPEKPNNPIEIYPTEYSGKTHHEKYKEVIREMYKSRLDAFIITKPDDICWLLNIRGSDIPHNPLPLCYAIIYAEDCADNSGKVALFSDRFTSSHERDDNGNMEELGKYFGDDVKLFPQSKITEVIKSLKGKKVGYDSNASPIWFYNALKDIGADIEKCNSPCTLAKACKNSTELRNTRNAHNIDAVAIIKLLYWFDRLEDSENISELDIEEQLELLRAEHSAYKGTSFATIAGCNENGAIVHYKADSESNKSIKVGDILLLDSGGQYCGGGDIAGTTDITRTFVRFGKNPENRRNIELGLADFRKYFTLVLKGHIALSSAVFPKGTTGCQLDVLARKPLWGAGLDYAHGTGHGVGVYSCVHEPPQSISRRISDIALQQGMILSIEPAYYEEGKFGIRIENLVEIVSAERGDNDNLLAFRPLTLVPIDSRLLDKDMLSEEEKGWLNDYHRRIMQEISPLIEEKSILAWLENMCKAI